MLLAAGYDVVVAADGLEAWEMLKDIEVDIIVSDVEMPVMNGFELTRRVRGSLKMKNLPVLLVTSLNAPEDRRQGIEAGADAYVIKGSSQHDELLQMVRRMA
jgi:two-component system chemotaxis sensor kinase CheA